MQTGQRLFDLGEKEPHHHKARVYETICIFGRSRLLICSRFDTGPCVACLVRMRDEVLLLHNWDNNYLLWIASALKWINSGNSHISLATIWCPESEGQNWIDGRVLQAKTYKSNPRTKEQQNADYLYSTAQSGTNNYCQSHGVVVCDKPQINRHASPNVTIVSWYVCFQLSPHTA